MSYYEATKCVSTMNSIVLSSTNFEFIIVEIMNQPIIIIIYMKRKEKEQKKLDNIKLKTFLFEQNNVYFLIKNFEVSSVRSANVRMHGSPETFIMSRMMARGR